MITTSKTPASANALRIHVTYLKLITLKKGTLNGWLGPALRGLVLKSLRDRVCEANGGFQGKASLTQAGERTDNDKYCVGCVKNDRCHYGRVFEPDMRVIYPQHDFRGANQGLRGVTIGARMWSSTFTTATAPASTCIWARLLSAGPIAERMVPEIESSLEELGARQGLGGRRSVLFSIDHFATQADAWTLEAGSLPTEIDRSIIPRVTIALESPLSLKRCESKKRRSRRTFAAADSPPPTFDDFVRASMRTVRRAVTEFANPDFFHNQRLDSLFDAPVAELATTVSNELTFFRQRRVSHRQKQHRWQSGWVGSVTFRNVPAAYYAWLVWGGRLGVGDSRNCGAGVWDTIPT